jgi:hypothetical protein
MIYLRKRIIDGLAPTGGYEAGAIPNIPDMGSNWFLLYATIMALIHHLFLFLVSASNLSLVGNIIYKTVLSVVFTALVLFFFQKASLSFQRYQLRRRR